MFPNCLILEKIWMFIKSLDTNVILLVTAVLILVYTIITWYMRNQAIQSNMLTVFINVHKRLASVRSYRMRSYLHEKFPNDLVQATVRVLGDEYIVRNEENVVIINVNNVIQRLEEDRTKLREFNQALKSHSTSFNEFNALEAVEGVLIDFDIIAFPYYKKRFYNKRIKPSKKVAKAYKDVLKETAIKILPFGAIQKKLRGNKEYKIHYLYLLKKLGIDLQGLNVPKWR